MELITNTHRKPYLATKPRAYQIGWFAAERGDSFKQIDGHPKTQYHYETGYHDSMSNSEAMNGEVFN